MRRMRAGVKLSTALTLILVLGLAPIAAAQNAGAADPPLTFGNNFFVTGDYVVAGAQGMTSNFTLINSTQYAIGTITVPDLNPGINPSVITGTNAVPTGAQIVAAILYWQTVEKTGVMPGQPGSGQKGFFRPLIAGGVMAPGYPISGSQLNPNGSNAVSWSSGGCTNGSTGKVVRTYRTSVLGYLPIDSNGNVRPNVQYEVRLPGTSSTTPIAVGASLVLIYRVISPNFPLNSIVIYDGDFATNATSVAAMTMTQAMQGFYDAETDLTQHPGAKLESRLTHIVGNGKAKKTETVSLNGQVLPSFYPNGHPSFPPYTGAQPPFPGFYGTWDNPTWTFDPGQRYVSLSNPVGEHSGSATTQVAASGANPGCVDWGATIVSTTVNNSDEDGILDVWKVPLAPNANTPGYCDASLNEGQCNGPGGPAWVDLPGATLYALNPLTRGQKDVFIQLDYMCSSPNGVDSCTTGDGTNYSFDPRQTGADVLMTNAFSAQGIHLHINPVNPLGTTQPVHAIQELTCMDNSNNPLCASVNANGLTPFPNQPGVVGWKAGFEFIQSQPLNYPDEISCEQALSGPCIRRFQPGRKDSYHYALFAHAIGTPTWGLEGGSLASVTAFTNGDIKFTTSAPHGLVVDPNLGNGRVTIADAITNPNLNGTYKVTSVSPPAGVLNITGTSMSALGIATYTFTQVSGPAPVAGDLVTVENTTNGNTVFNVGNATIASVVGSTFTVNFNVNGFVPSAIAAQAETGGCAPAFPTRACAHTNSAPFYFTINISPSTVSTQTSYTELTDPNLTVTSGQATTGSGFSDIGGADTLVTLGLWGNPAFNGSTAATSPPSDGQKETVQAGTFMHELGHTLGLTHGGLFFDNLAHNDYTPTFDANCKSNYQSVMNYMFQTDLLGPSNALDFSSQQLDPLNETLLFPIALGGSMGAVKFQTTTWYDLAPSLVGSKAKHHCDGSPTFFNANVPPFSADVTPIMYPHLNKALPSPWSAPSLDINFNGTIDAGFRGYDDWANVDLRQIGASGPDLGGPGRSGGGPGRSGGGPGRSGGGPGRSGGGPGRSGGGPGKEIDFATANDITRPPRNLMASEEVSPRFIDLSWTAPIFGQIGAYRIYRSADGGRTFSLIATVPGSQTTFQDGVTTPPPCNPTGYQYFVTAVLAGTFAAFPPGPTEGQESEPSNTVSVGQNTETLTACYGPAGFNFSAPANAVQGSIPAITWTVQDASNKSGFGVPVSAVNTLVVNGPLPSSCTTVGDTTILANGMLTAQSGALSAFSQPSQGQYTFNWDTDGFCAGQYAVKLILDNQLALSSHQMATALLQLSIDVTDTDSTNPHITTTAIPNGVVGTFYSTTISEHGGVTGPNPFTWTLANGSNPLPAGLSLGTAPDRVSGLLSGIPSAAGMFQITVQVTDSVGNMGTQTLTMTVTTPVAQINQPLVPDSSVPGAAQFVLTLNGTGFGPGSVVQWNGTPLVTAFISNRRVTAAIPVLDVAALGTASVSVSNPVTVGNKAVPNSNIDFFQITPATSASLSRTDSPTGNNPDGLIAADFGNGKLDLAIANSADNTVTILLGNGDGTFTAQPNLSTGAGSDPQLPIAGDFNGDGKLDLAVANFANNTVSVFLGNGDGTFQAPATYAVGNGPSSVVTGDFDRDGKLDLAVANQNDATVSILLGKGDGTFQAHVDYAAVPAAAAIKDVAGVALGDLNGDGELDLVVANPSNNTVSVLIGKGDGTFQAPVAYPTGNHPINFGVADLNGDGNLDLAVANLTDRTVSVLIGNGNGTFKPQVSYPTTSGAVNGPTAVATGDFNGDGTVDLAITNSGDNSVSILLGKGDGTLQAPLEFTTGNNAAGVAAGDFNGDGRLDVAVADFSANAVSIMLQRPEPASNLAVSGVTASQVSLTWTASTSTTVTGYNVYRGTTTGGPYTKVNLAVVAKTVFTDITVNPGTTYFYVVTAVDPGSLESVRSNQVSASTPPQAPASLTATAQPGPPVSVLLNWTVSTNAVSYNVYRSTTSGVYTTPLVSVNAGTSYTDITVNPGTTYFYVVTAVGPGNAESVKSIEVSASTPPQAPASLTATAQAGPPVSVLLNWPVSTNAVSYNVYRSTTSGMYTTPLTSVNAGTSYTDMSVQSGTTYFYVVTAVGPGNAESVKSPEASASP